MAQITKLQLIVAEPRDPQYRHYNEYEDSAVWLKLQGEANYLGSAEQAKVVLTQANILDLIEALLGALDGNRVGFVANEAESVVEMGKHQNGKQTDRSIEWR